jgi:hypothetical protein
MNRQVVFNKGLRLGRETSLVSKWCWNNWIAKCKRMSLNPNTNSKLVTDLNAKPAVTKLREISVALERQFSEI